MSDAPPFDQLAEESVLGAMLMSARAIEEAVGRVQAKDFYKESHGKIFTTITAMHDRGDPVDALTLAHELDTRGLLESVGGQSRVHELAVLVPAASNVSHYARIVADRSAQRALRFAGQRIQELAAKGGTTDELRASAEQILTAAMLDGLSAKALSITEGLDEMLAPIREAYQTRVPVMGLTTNYTALDRMLSGLWPGQLILLAARPGMGKSAMALNVCENVVDAGGTALFVSLEMARFELQLRSLARAAKINSRELGTGLITEQEAQSLPTALKLVKGRDGKLLVMDDGDVTLAQLRAEGARLKRQEDLSLMVVDYLQLMTGSGEENRATEVGQFSRGLKLLARRLEIPILALSQMNRSIEGRQSKRPVLSDLRESGSLEQDSDVVLFLHDDAAYDPDKEPSDVVELIVAKNRKGESGGTVKIGYERQYSNFHNVSQE